MSRIYKYGLLGSGLFAACMMAFQHQSYSYDERFIDTLPVLAAMIADGMTGNTKFIGFVLFSTMFMQWFIPACIVTILVTKCLSMRETV